MPLGIPIVSSEDGRRLVEYKPSNHSINKGRWTKEEVGNLLICSMQMTPNDVH
jgi:uncharacterized protein YllA (UPF0747 family)